MLSQVLCSGEEIALDAKLAHNVRMEVRYPIRINKYLAEHKYCTRREADVLIAQDRVLINGRPATLGQRVHEGDAVEVRLPKRSFRYIAYHKPRGIITHSAQEGEEEIADVLPVQGVFPVGRLDKDSHGLIILTNDGRLTDALLSPRHEHEKEYEVTTKDVLPDDFQHAMERGVYIGDYRTKPCTVRIVGPRRFLITLTEGKKRQIRRMCGVFGQSAEELKRMRVLNIRLGSLKEGEYRDITGSELKEFLSALEIPIAR